MATKIGKVLSQIIADRGLTLRAIAKGSGVPASTLGEWQANRTPKNPQQVRAVAKFLQVSVHYLLFDEEDAQDPIQKIIKENFFQGTFEITVKKVKI